MSFRETFSRYLEPSELDRFALWAFGSRYKEFDGGLEFMRAWNIRHGDSLKLEPFGMVTADAPRMVELYKEQHERRIV